MTSHIVTYIKTSSFFWIFIYSLHLLCYLHEEIFPYGVPDMNNGHHRNLSHILQQFKKQSQLIVSDCMAASTLHI